MNIETRKAPILVRDSYTEMIMALKPGQVLRLHTAQEWRGIGGVLARIGKERGVKFGTMNEGDSDVLVYIKAKP